MHYMDAYKTNGEKACQQLHKNAESDIEQRSSCTASYQPSRRLSKLDEPDMRDTDGEVETSS